MTIQNTDIFLVGRENINYKTEAQNLMAIQDTDLLMVERGSVLYKTTGSDLKSYATINSLFISYPNNGETINSNSFTANSCFNDSSIGSTHISSTWQVTTSADTTFSSPIINDTSTTYLDYYPLSDLTSGSSYLIRVRYNFSDESNTGFSSYVAFSISSSAYKTLPPSTLVSVPGSGVSVVVSPGMSFISLRVSTDAWWYGVDVDGNVYGCRPPVYGIADTPYSYPGGGFSLIAAASQIGEKVKDVIWWNKVLPIEGSNISAVQLIYVNENGILKGFNLSIAAGWSSIALKGVSMHSCGETAICYGLNGGVYAIGFPGAVGYARLGRNYIGGQASYVITSNVSTPSGFNVVSFPVTVPAGETVKQVVQAGIQSTGAQASPEALPAYWLMESGALYYAQPPSNDYFINISSQDSSFVSWITGASETNPRRIAPSLTFKTIRSVSGYSYPQGIFASSGFAFYSGAVFIGTNGNLYYKELSYVFGYGSGAGYFQNDFLTTAVSGSFIDFIGNYGVHSGSSGGGVYPYLRLKSDGTLTYNNGLSLTSAYSDVTNYGGTSLKCIPMGYMGDVTMMGGLGSYPWKYNGYYFTPTKPPLK